DRVLWSPCTHHLGCRGEYRNEVRTGSAAMTQHSLITGLEYVPRYIDQEIHDRLLCAIDQHPWLTSVDHRVQLYGYRYNHEHRAAYQIGELPEWATDLASRLHEDGVSRIPNQLVANEYQPGCGIFDHMDQAVFGDVVMSVSLGSTCLMRFTHSESHVSRELLLEPRSLLILSREARW